MTTFARHDCMRLQHIDVYHFRLQFARGSDGGYAQYAIKFFSREEDFEKEVCLYKQPMLRCTLPDLICASSNADGTVRSLSGVPFGPFMVLERGSSLTEYDASCLKLGFVRHFML